MFQKLRNSLTATDDATDATVRFSWSAPGLSSRSELAAYEIDGKRYLMDCEGGFHRRGFFRRDKFWGSIRLRSVRQEQLAGPSVPNVSPAMRGRIATDLRAAASALEICCEIIE